MKITKYLSVTVLVLLSLLVTTFSFAYWAGAINKPEAVMGSNTIEIGTGNDVTTELVLSSTDQFKGKKLVPVGFKTNDDDDDEIEAYIYTHAVTWKSTTANTNANGVERKLTVTDPILLVDGKDVKDMFNVEVTGYDENTMIELGQGEKGVDVTFKITLKEPDTKVQYDSIAGKDLSLQATFSVADQ